MEAGEKLRLLVPLLDDTLTIEEIKSILRRLKDQKHINTDKKYNLKHKRNEKWFMAYDLVDTIHKYGKSWVEPFRLAVYDISNEYSIGKIVSYFLSTNNKMETELIWLFENWNSLKNIDINFEGCNISQNLRNNQDKVAQLLRIADYFITIQDRTKLLELHQSIKRTLEQKLKLEDDQSMKTADLQKYSLRNIKRFLSESLTPSTLHTVADHMAKQNCFSQQTLKLIKNEKTFSRKMNLFVSELEKMDKDQCKWALFDAISKGKLTDLYDILVILSQEQNHMLQQIVGNYDLIITKENSLKQEFSELCPQSRHGIRWFQGFILKISDLDTIRKTKICNQVQEIIFTSPKEETKKQEPNKIQSSSEKLAKLEEKKDNYDLRSGSQYKETTRLTFENEANSKEQPCSTFSNTQIKKERRVEFYLLLDVNDKNKPKPTAINVYINRNEHATKLELNKEKDFYEGNALVSDENKMVYKYHHTTREKCWERLPGYMKNRVYHMADLDSRESVKIFDICTFENTMGSPSDIHSMYARNLSKFLPDLSLVNKSGIIYFKSLLEDLWLYCCKPMQLESHPFSPLSFQTNMRSNFYNYVKTNKDGKNEVSKILVVLTVLLLDVKHKIDFKLSDWNEQFSQALILTTHDDNSLKVLHSTISALFENKGMAEIIEKVAEMLPLDLHRMFVLPLSYFMLNNGSIKHNHHVWFESIGILKLDNIQKMKSPLDHILLFKSMIPACPQILSFYQTLLSAADTILLMEKDEELKKYFTIDIFMNSLNDALHNDFVNITKDVTIKEWIFTSIEFLNQGPKSDVEKIYENACKLLKKVESGKEINLEAAKWILSIFCNVLKLKNNCKYESGITLIFALIKEIIKQRLKKQEYKKRIQFWNFVMELEIAEETTRKDIWTSKIQSILKDGFLQELESDTELAKYLENIDAWGANKEVEMCFYDAVNESISKKSDQNGSWWPLASMKNYFKAKNNAIVQIFENIFDKKWKLCDGDILQFIRWPFLTHFYKLFDDDSIRSNFSKPICTRVQTVKNKIEQLNNQWKSGEIDFCQFKRICQNSEDFLRALEIIAQENVNPEEAKNLIQARKQILEEFLRTKSYLDYFLKLCQTLEMEDVFLNKLQGVLNKDYDNSKWSSLYCSSEEGVFWSLDNNVLHSLGEIVEYHVKDDTLLFTTWKSLIGRMQEDLDKSNDNLQNAKLNLSAQISHIIDLVWRPLKEIMFKHKTNILQGSISFDELRKISEPHTTFNEENCIGIVCTVLSFSEDLEMLNTDKLLTRKVLRNQQISGFFQLKNKIQHSAELRLLIELLCLEGDYSFLDICELNEEELLAKPIAEMPDDVNIMCNEMSSITEEHIKTIRNFVKQRELVEWLKNNMKDRGEVKVMSDLAMISAGETTLEVDKVSCFVSSVMGFSPLLFDLKEDASFLDIIDATKAVIENKKQDSRFDKKWESTGQYLSWLDEIKNMHGSVEESSLSSAQDIICRGIFQIGGERAIIPSLNNSLLLKILAKENKDENKEMGLEELQNLRSRLMLIAGEAQKGTEDVKKFINILAVVENLTLSYIQLKLSGCLLFNSWTATLVCCENELNLLIQFEEGSRSLVFNNNVMDELKQLIDVMKDVYRKWNQRLNEKRDIFYELNNFSIKQIIFLCKNLSRVESDEFLCDQVYTLLSCIKNDVTHADISHCWRQADHSEDEQSNTDMDIEDDQNDEKSDLERKQELFYKLCEDFGEDFENKDAIKAAIQDIGIDQEKFDHDNRYLWVMEHENDENFEDELKILAVQFDNEIGIQQSTVPVLDSIVNNQSKLSLNGVVEMILNDESLLASAPSVVVNTVCTRYFEKTDGTSLYDCISIDHLGTFLQHLSIKAQNKIKRELPKELNTGTPNLVVCSKGSLISYMLSIYGNNNDQPLPTTSEVLICTSSTTREDIELFLRRAVGKNKEKLTFCLGAAEKLSFELSELVDSFLKKLEGKNDNPNYQLVILTESSDHYISSFFDEQKIEYKITADNQPAKDYIKSQMSCKNHDDSPANIMKEGRLVELVLSERAGLGKSLYISRLKNRVSKNCHVTTIRFLEKIFNVDSVLDMLLSSENPEHNSPRFIHFDVTPSVKEGLYSFLLNLIILGSIENSSGVVWRRNTNHVYVIEYTLDQSDAIEKRFLDLLPSMLCLSPLETVNDGVLPNKVYMDEINFQSDMFQRPYQYLERYSQNHNLDKFKYQPGETNGTPKGCVNTLLKYFSTPDPTWSELRHFSSFLNCQLQDCEDSFFCDANLVGQDSGLNSFKNFVVKFMIEMSQEFATSSMPNLKNEENVDALGHHQLEKKWNENIHPYLFFNHDRMSMSFINFRVNASGNMVHPKTLSLMSPSLYKGLTLQRVNLNQNYDALSRRDKLQTLIEVLGVEKVGQNFDPDTSYELTTDNVLKILAIQMRFRCGIPVVIMGETGCGKTRMVEFMSKLKQGHHQNLKNMIIVKVHGGTTVGRIQEHVQKAVALAKENFKRKPSVETLLFLDEANTTEAIYAIKEFVCDGTINGKNMEAQGLCIIAACNPYKKHDEATIKKMEDSGLGFRVRTEDTADKLGTIPMRCLVYRVIELPPSMQPLVWDFGELNSETESAYIRQMVEHMDLGTNKKLSNTQVSLIVDILATSQEFMRCNRSQCRFVSLRDVERCLLCFIWFSTNSVWLFDEYENPAEPLLPLEHVYYLRPLLLALGMCYHVTLEERKEYREQISLCLEKQGCHLTESDISETILSCQMNFLEHIDLDEDIACNEALLENSFMMVMCAELRIPLFVVGKPGSSKSLAKTVVTHSMQGQSSKSDFFRHLKEIHVLSFQCSAVADAVGIEAVFNQCATLQSKRDLSKFVAVVVLDEIGLAEDSPKMPLKVLHPLLESGVNEEELLCENGGNEKDSTSESSDYFQQDGIKNKGFGKVGFIGISNWALDPAKLNRGIFVQRGSPTKTDLMETARGIFQSTRKEYEKDVDKLVTVITDSYMDMYEKQDQEFFGLRDYYGLLKMIFYVVSKGERNIEFIDVVNATLRNFSGGKNDCIKTFMNGLKEIWPGKSNPHQTLRKMIQDNLNSVDTLESRFLLLLTNQYAAAHLLTDLIDSTKFQFIFGSSFSQDNDYTAMCKNINRIKICMETGSTVVLLNLRDLYESLYDALNQHYLTFAGQRYVDLGLGGHRVKCRVSDKFRLIVIEDKNVVYEEFPIPLINRLEKHIFTTESVLDEDQKLEAESLGIWVQEFAKIIRKLSPKIKSLFLPDVFLGYSSDSIASAILSNSNGSAEIGNLSKFTLLGTSTIDAVFRLEQTKLTKESLRLREKYFRRQEHDHLYFLMKSMIDSSETSNFQQIEITSFSKILSESEKKKLASALGLEDHVIKLLTLQQFKTEADFFAKVELFFENALDIKNNNEKCVHILLIQCAQSELNQSLIACAKYSVKNIIQSKNLDLQCHNIIVAFVFTTERNCGATHGNIKRMISMSSPDCPSVYVDELRAGVDYIGPPSKMWRRQLSEIIGKSKDIGEKVECNFTKDDFLLDMEKLVKVCIPEALLKLEDPDQQNATERLKAIFEIFNNEQIGHGFLNILFQHISTLTKAKDDVLPDEEWAINVASNQTYLNEAGTFTKALWLKIKEKTAKVLAKMLSFIDEDSNILLLSNNLKLAETWLRLFNNPELFSLTWNGTESTFDVTKTYSALFPFSRRVTNFFNEHWTLAGSADSNDKKGLFMSRLQKTEVFRITSAANKKAFLESYTNDLVHLNFIGKLNGRALNLVVSSLLSMFYCQRNAVRENDGTYDENALVTMFVILNEALPSIKLFQSLVSLERDFLTPSNIKNLKTLQDKADKFILHSLYFEIVLDDISLPFNSNEHSLENFTSFSMWTPKVQEVKRFADNILKNPFVENLNLKWKSLLFAELFLHQLIPDSIDEELLYKGYLKILFPMAKRMYKASKMKDGQNSILFFNIIRKNIGVCINEIFLKLLLNWEDLKCVQCKKTKVKDPVLFQCGHFTCKDCIDIHVLTQKRNCPVCRVDFDADFVVEPTSLTPPQNEDWMAFKSNCTSFILDYLCTVCFPESSCGLKNANAFVKDVILELVVGKKRQSHKESAIFDENPAIRSFILTILMENFLAEAEVVFEEQLQMNCDFDLMNIFIKSKENAVWKCKKDLPMCSFKQKVTNEITKMTPEIVAEGFVNQLNLVAYLKVGLKLVLKDIKHNKFDAEFSKALFCTNDDNCPKEYLVKLICLKIGSETFSKMVENELYNYLVPDALLSSTGDYPTKIVSSFTAAAGSDYVTISEFLVNYDYEDCIQAADKLYNVAKKSTDAYVQVMLSLFDWLQTKNDYNKEKLEVYNTLVRFFEKGNFPVPDTKIFPTCFIQCESWNVKCIVVDAILTIKSKLLGKQLMEELRFLLENPSLVSSIFLPTIPQSGFFDVKAIMKTFIEQHRLPPKPYQCPNGHPYYVGDCTNVVAVDAICPDCKEPIGGLRERVLKPGNTAGELTEESQKGYLLDEPNRRPDHAVPERAINKLAVCVIRFLLHACLLYNSKALTTIKGKWNNQQSAETFFGLQLKKDLHQLATGLAKSLDDTCLLLHQVLKKIRLTENLTHFPIDISLKTMGGRKNWEKEFHDNYLKDIFKNLEFKIDEARALCLTNEKDNHLHNIIYEKNSEQDIINEETSVTMWNSPSLWKYRTHANVDHFRQKLELNFSKAQRDGFVLLEILNNDNVPFIPLLMDIVCIQEAIISRYGKIIDILHEEGTTVLDFYRDGRCRISKEMFNNYFNTWNKAKRCIVDDSNVPQDLRNLFGEEMTFNSPVDILLPTKTGNGRCARYLTEYIVKQQNSLIHLCRENIDYSSNFQEVKVSELTINDLISCDEEKWLPFILANADHKIIEGPVKKQEITYKFASIEKQVLERFIFCKKLIDGSTLPLYEKHQKLEDECMKLRENVKQVNLPNKDHAKFDHVLGKATLVDICEGLRTLSLVISYLAKMNCSSHLQDQLLQDFLKHDLMLPDEEATIVGAPKSAKLQHTLAIFERLSWQRSAKNLLSGNDPFAEVLNTQEKVVDVATLRSVLLTLDNRQLQIGINSLLNLKKGLHSNGKLKDFLKGYIDENEGESEWCSKLPDDLCIKHIPHIFEVSLNLTQ